jgi:hypothetical protein
MRILVAVAVICLASCASEKLAQAPPAGVDFTGRWKLNEADSDDPQRLLLAQINGPGGGQSSAPGGSGGGGGRGGRGGGRGGAGPGLSGPAGPAMPSVSAMGESLRWPGKQLEIKQVAGVVAFTSDGGSVICQPMEGGPHRRTHGDGAGRDGDASRRDVPSRSRDAPPPRCGWAEKILIVENRDSDDDHPPFEEHFGLSEDGRRLVEIVAFKGGRSSGFTMSRVWDRID